MGTFTLLKYIFREKNGTFTSLLWADSPLVTLS